MSADNTIHGQWSSRLAFVLAATGSAVGLGNIWRFPYLAGENGGGAFVVLYLACVLLVGLPLMSAEILLGRRGRRNPMNAMHSLALAARRTPWWGGVGLMGILAGLLILAFYSVVAGWLLFYLYRSMSGWSTVDAAGLDRLFSSLLSSPLWLVSMHTLFMVLTIAVVAMGVRGGLERSVKILMPTLLCMLLLLFGYAAGTPGFAEGVRYLLVPDFTVLAQRPALLLEALGQAFFSLSIGMGALMAYGAYLPKHVSVFRMACWVTGLDTLVALLAGLAIMPLLFSYGLTPAQGTGLVFKTLPLAFGEMPGGQLWAMMFFLLLTIAAWTSAISLMEPATAWLIENHKFSRPLAALAAGGTAWLLGVGCALSLNVWQGYKLFDKNLFELLDYLTAKLMLPIGGVLIGCFAGWVISRSLTLEELRVQDGLLYRAWLFAVRYLAPAAVLVVFLNALGIIGFSG